MKKAKEYLIPIGIGLVLFYIAGCLMENTFILGGMEHVLRRALFGIWLGVSLIFAAFKAGN